MRNTDTKVEATPVGLGTRIREASNAHVFSNLYWTAFENGDIAPEGFLLVNELPAVVRCRWSVDKSNNWSIVIEAEPRLIIFGFPKTIRLTLSKG